MRRATPHRAPLTTERRPRRDAQRFDLRDRAAAANQLLLCGIVAVMFVVGLVSGVFQRPELFALGALINAGLVQNDGTRLCLSEAAAHALRLDQRPRSS